MPETMGVPMTQRNGKMRGKSVFVKYQTIYCCIFAENRGNLKRASASGYFWGPCHCLFFGMPNPPQDGNNWFVRPAADLAFSG